MNEQEQAIQEAINSIRKRQSLSGLVKPNKQTLESIIILDELIRLATFVQEVQPQLQFFNIFGQIVAKEREDFEDNEDYQERFEWLASMEIEAQQEMQVQHTAAMEAMAKAQQQVAHVEVIEELSNLATEVIEEEKPTLRLV